MLPPRRGKHSADHGADSRTEIDMAVGLLYDGGAAWDGTSCSRGRFQAPGCEDSRDSPVAQVRRPIRCAHKKVADHSTGFTRSFRVQVFSPASFAAHHRDRKLKHPAIQFPNPMKGFRYCCVPSCCVAFAANADSDL